MGVLDTFLNAIKINDDEDDNLILDDDDLVDYDDEGDFLDDDDDAESRPKTKFFEKFSRKKAADDLDDLDDPMEEGPKPSFKTAPKAPAKQTEKPARSVSSKITPMRSSRRQNQATNVEVCVIKPTSMEETREIADTLLDNSTVILNLEGIDVELAQRIIDFASGACYSLNGSLQKISSYIFVLGPSSVDITGDLQNILGGSAPSVRAGY